MNDLIHAQLEKYPDQYLLAYIDVYGRTLLTIEELSIREKYSWMIDKLQQRETCLQLKLINSQQS